MPAGLVRSGDFRKGSPILLPHQFGNPVSLPEPSGNVMPQSNPTLNSNPVTWTPSPPHFGNQVAFSLQVVPPIVIITEGGSQTTSAVLTNLLGTNSATLTYSGAPAGVTISFAPNPDTGTSVATITVGASVPTGRYTITIEGSASGANVEFTNIQLVVVSSGAAGYPTYYVSPTGSDSNNGTSSSTPWQTIAKVNAHTFVAGDTIAFQGGQTFSGTIAVSPVGTAAAPITFTSYGTGQAIITPTTDGFDFTNAQYVTVSNLTITGGGWTGSALPATLPQSSVVNTSGTAVTWVSGTTFSASWAGHSILINNTYHIISAVNSSTSITLTASASTQSSVVSSLVTGGVYFFCTATSGGALQNNTVTNCNISGFVWGVTYDCRLSASLVGYDNPTVSYCNLSNNYAFAVFMQGYGAETAAGVVNAIQNIYIGYNTANYCGGEAYNLGSITGGTFEYNLALYTATITATGQSAGGGAGMAITNSRNVTFQYNEIGYTGLGGSYTDACAYDFDMDVQGCTLQYNLSYYNVGPFFEIGSFDGLQTRGNYIHHNISYNDARGGTNGTNLTEQGAISLWGGTTSNWFYNNTVYLGAGAIIGQPSCVSFGNIGGGGTNAGNYFLNNTFKTANGMPFFWSCETIGPQQMGAQTIVGNLYDSSGGSLLISNSNGTSYVNVTTLAAWQTDGYEVYNSVNYGVVGSADLLNLPAFNVPAAGFIGNSEALSSITNFDLTSGSSAIGNGVNLTLVGGTTLVGVKDWHGVAITSPINIGVSNTTSGSSQVAYGAYKTVTIQSSQVTANQTNFPVLVTGTYSYLKTVSNGGSVQSANGYDITFALTDSLDGGTTLPFELVNYNPATGAIEAWVMVPAISTSSNTPIYLLYGSSGVTVPTAQPAQVWRGYMGVWHFGSATVLSLTDSSGNQLSPVNHGATAGSGPTNFNGAVALASASSEYIDTGSVMTSLTGITLQAWVNNATSQTFGMVISNGRDSSEMGYELFTNSEKMYFQVGNAVGNSAYEFSTAMTIGTWYSTAVTCTSLASTQLAGYLNGAANGAITGSGATGILASLYNVCIGKRSNSSNGYFINGSIAEVRISGQVLTASWIATEYHNQNSPSTFYTVA